VLALHQVEWCPFCHRVRQVMTELGLSYTTVNVPARREERAELIALTDHAAVPVLEDGDRVVAGSDEIIEYLLATYPVPADAEDHRAMGTYRNATVSSLAPRAALARLKELLETNGLAVFAETDGADISRRLPAGYTLLAIGVPAAAAKAFALDAAAPSAVTLPVAVFPGEDGSVIAAADAVAMVWLFGESDLNKLQRSVRERVDAVFDQF
jgi:glutathione S-transferase